MKNTLFTRAIIVWIALCFVSGILLYAEQIRRQYWERDREYSALFSEISAVLTQNESVLPLLSGDEDITALNKKFPHLLALKKTTGRALDAARVEPASDSQYWLYNPWRQIRVRVDLARYSIRIMPLTASKSIIRSVANHTLQMPSGTGHAPSHR
ncbi:hypothetical protein ACP3P6_16270 [Enterobacter mori]